MISARITTGNVCRAATMAARAGLPGGKPLDGRHHAGPHSRRQLWPGGQDGSQAGVGLRVAQPADHFGLFTFRQPADGLDDHPDGVTVGQGGKYG